MNGYLYEEALKQKIKLKKFPEEFIAKVALVRNKHYLDKNIISLYEEYEQEENQKNSEIDLDKIKDEPDIKELLEMTLKQLANNYLKSDKFKTYYENLKKDKDKGEEKANNFVFWGNYFDGNKFCSNLI